ncbi:MAG: hypothetical protein F9K35_17155 [Burkholderiaceae bacterium]|nr:MAG: hypothetical protein F9K35_17155 [Burkholderiaceae bacterium]
MRPAGEVRQALLQACEALAPGFPVGRGPTLREIAGRACVGLEAARRTLNNMCRSGPLCQVNTRKVPYRNRPVAEYALAPMASAANDPVMGLALAIKAWG